MAHSTERSSPFAVSKMDRLREKYPESPSRRTHQLESQKWDYMEEQEVTWNARAAAARGFVAAARAAGASSALEHHARMAAERARDATSRLAELPDEVVTWWRSERV